MSGKSIIWTGKNYEGIAAFIRMYCGLITDKSWSDGGTFDIMFVTANKGMSLNVGDSLVVCGPTIPGWNPNAPLPLRVQNKETSK